MRSPLTAVRPRALVGATLAGALLLGACSDGSDDAPRDGTTTSNAALSSTTTGAPAATSSTSTTSTTLGGRALVTPTTVVPLEATPEGVPGVRVVDLVTGDCADIAGLGLDESVAVTHAERTDCAEPHGIEVFLVSALDAADDAAFPGHEAVVAIADETCLTAFADYVGLPYVETPLEIVHLRPDEAAWAAGARNVQCALHSRDLMPLTGSMRRVDG